MSKPTKTHIQDWRNPNATLCGRVVLPLHGEDPLAPQATLASNPHAATCRRCRTKRDGRYGMGAGY